jgi:DsbE subfamily thiol:disulfide oxidoreductase
MKKYSLIYALVFLTGFFLFLSFIAGDRAESFNPMLIDSKTGKSAPDFTLADLSGKEVTLSAYKGKTVLLNFWATWCPYCRKERAHLNTLSREYREEGLIILSVATDRSVSKVKDYIKKTPADFIVLSDSRGSVSAEYGVSGFPTSFLIDSNGMIKQRVVGFREWTSPGSRRLIDKLIAN